MRALKFRHIFVVTYGRSGSTLLNGILNTIPGVHMRGENAKTLAHLSRAVGAVSYSYRFAADASSSRHPWYGASGIDREAFKRNLVNAFVENVLSPPSDAIAVGFKEIRHGWDEMFGAEYDAYIEFLLNSFERPCILFNVRNPDDVRRSEFWLSRPFVKSHLRRVEARFRRSYLLHPDTTFWVDYDRYVRDPEDLRRLFDFLGAEYDRPTVDRVLSTRHSIDSPKEHLEELRAARSTFVWAFDTIALAVRRFLVG